LKTELLQKLPCSLHTPVEEELQRLEAENHRLTLANQCLQERLRLILIKKYGAKSEQLNDAQLQLLEDEPGVSGREIELEAELPEPEKAAAAKVQKRRHPGRHELPAHLPRVEKIVPCLPEQCQCGQCQKTMPVIGYDISEELDVIPAKYVVNVIKKEKRACRDCPEMGVSTAPSEPKPVDKCKASTGVIVDVIINKYCNHLPIYRQCAIFLREADLELSRMTLCGWVMQSGAWLEAVCGAMRADLLAGSYIQADETTIGVQSKQTKGRNHLGYMWEYSRPGGPVVFDFRMGRSREGPRKFLGQFNGFLQSDGYGAYDCIGGAGIEYAGCMAHARRGFVDALKLEPGHAEALSIVGEIAQLYAVEKEAREGQLTHPEREALRHMRSLPVLASLKKKITALHAKHPPQTAFGKACRYALSQWERLIVFATHGEVEIDNNWCENAIRPIALGRKNWLHLGSEQAGPRVAAILSVIETCRRLDINVRAYLMDVLPRIPNWPLKDIAELTPMAWAARQAAAKSVPAAYTFRASSA
jgi:transposase